MEFENTLNGIIKKWAFRNISAKYIIEDLIKDTTDRTSKLCDEEISKKTKELKKDINEFEKETGYSLYLEDFDTTHTKSWEATLYHTGLEAYLGIDKSVGDLEEYYNLDISNLTKDEIFFAVNTIMKNDIKPIEKEDVWIYRTFEMGDYELKIHNTHRNEYEEFTVNMEKIKKETIC